MPTLGYVKDHVKVADELFLILALLQRENPQREAFTVGEMLERAKAEGLGARPESLRAHASGHAAANRPPGKNGKYRMVFVEADGRIRLLAPSDYVHPDRHQKMYPDRSDIPVSRPITDIHQRATRGASAKTGEESPRDRWLNLRLFAKLLEGRGEERGQESRSGAGSAIRSDEDVRKLSRGLLDTNIFIYTNIYHRALGDGIGGVIGAASFSLRREAFADLGGDAVLTGARPSRSRVLPQLMQRREREHFA